MGVKEGEDSFMIFNFFGTVNILFLRDKVVIYIIIKFIILGLYELIIFFKEFY